MMSRCQIDSKYEKHVMFLRITFIWGILANCFLFNLEGDREFHWYSVVLVILSMIAAARKAYIISMKNGATSGKIS